MPNLNDESRIWLPRALRGSDQQPGADVATRLAEHYHGLGLPRWEVLRLVALWNRQATAALPSRELVRVVRAVCPRGGIIAGRTPAFLPGERFSKALSSLALENSAEPEWLCERLIERGTIGFDGGEPKLTKSWFALYIGLCLSLGEPLFGRFKVPRKVPVLYINEEDSARLVLKRIQLLRQGHQFAVPDDDFFHYSIRRGFRIDNPEWFARLRADLRHFKPGMVVLDVFNKLHTREENSQPAMTEVMSLFEDLRREFGCSFLIVHHFRKVGGKRGNQALRGSSVLGGWSESSFYLTQVKGGMYRIEHESKMTKVDPFIYALEDVLDENKKQVGVRFDYKGEAGPSWLQGTRNEVLRAIADGFKEDSRAGTTLKALRRRTGYAENTIRDHADQLVRDGSIQKSSLQTGGKGQTQICYVPLVTDKPAS